MHTLAETKCIRTNCCNGASEQSRVLYFVNACVTVLAGGRGPDYICMYRAISKIGIMITAAGPNYCVLLVVYQALLTTCYGSDMSVARALGVYVKR